MRLGAHACASVELEVLLQRASRGRNELELRRLDEANQRHNRFRCMVQVGASAQQTCSVCVRMLVRLVRLLTRR